MKDVSPSALRGGFTLFSGCMFSGKTTELLRCVRGWPACAVRTFKHRSDDRAAEGMVMTHTGAAIPAVGLADARHLADYPAGPEALVAIDEAQFFDAHLPTVIGALTTQGVTVVATALDLDSWARPFSTTAALMRMADRIIRLHTVCARCHRRADRTQRLTPISGGRMIGGAEAYEPRCITCWRPPMQTPEACATM